MYKIRISAVRYSNTYPLIYGLRFSGIDLNANIEIDHPADSARKMLKGESEIALIPVAAIPSIPDITIISDFCIGTNGPVKTVMLLSNSPIDNIETVYLDYRSRTSVMLTRILAKKFWKCNFKWKDTWQDFNFTGIGEREGLVLIGDQCYELGSGFRYRTDLAEEWTRYTGMPFVFACWVTNKNLNNNYIQNFNNALAFGVNNIDKVVEWYKDKGSMTEPDLRDYLNNCIDYKFDEKKRLAMNTFFTYLDDIN